jgi:L-2-hydroxyglutarate oxidase LhgO
MDKVDAIVIGAGVVGLAVARALARRGLETLLLERARTFGTATSSRNSEVVHAGIYYPAGSLKARLCVRGRHLLTEFCASRGVGLQRCGKLIVASSAAQLAALEALQHAGQRNGVDDLQLLDATSARALEPALQCTAALHSPGTAIVDSHGLMLALLADFESAGGTIAYGAEVRGGAALDGGLVLEVAGEEAMTIAAGIVVNSCGLQAQQLALSLDGMPAHQVPALHLAKGSYFSLAGRAPFSRLIYPVPEAGGLGVHLTLDLGGQARFGPDVEWVQSLDYRVDAQRAEAFYAAIRRYWPALPDAALQPDYAGIRPKLSGPGEPTADFSIQTAAEHGLNGLINLFGIESPGLTASLAIADYVAALR